MDPDDLADGGEPSSPERILLGAIRLASLPVFAFVILTAGLCYGSAIVARRAGSLAARGLRRAGGVARAWHTPVGPQET